jgi:site-specific recombinase
VPTVLAFDAIHRASTGRHFLDETTAAYVVGSFHPLRSPVIWFATLTGVFLWLASLGAGWLENWAVYRRMPEAIEQSRIRRVLGAGAARFLAMGFRRHVAGVGGSVTLGFLLAFMPVFGKGFGLPIGVAHVTLSAGSLALAGLALGVDRVLTADYVWAMVGVVCIGLLNFGVSFALALGVAVRARAVGRKDQLAVLRALLVRLVRRPFEFIYPGKAEPDEGAHG